MHLTGSSLGALPGACYRLSVQRIHWRYKSDRATCHVTNLDPETDACKSTHPKTYHNTTFTWLEHASPGTKSCGIIGAHNRGPYPAQVTVYPYNRYIRGTNPVVRHVMSLTWTLKRIRANQRAKKHAATQPLHDSNTRAPAPNLVASWERRV